MKDFAHLTPEELNKMDKNVLILVIRSLQDQLNTITNQLTFLTEQIALMNQRSFGRKTEKSDQIAYQMSLYDIFNEPELLTDNSPEPEVEEISVSSHTRKKKTTRELKLEGLPARIIEHKLTEKELKDLFPAGYKELPVETYKRLALIPQTFIVDEHHVHVYASKDNDGVIVRAERPKDVFRNSLATPSLLAATITGKYLNHLPLDRQARCYADYGVDLGTNTLANWMMEASDKYFSLVYDELHRQLLETPVIHADETPFQVIKDGRKAGSESFMWVYRSGACDIRHPIVLYDYQPTRRTDRPDEFLGGYTGTLVTDGYQVYHSLEKKRDGLKVAGCWIHAKRKFAELVKAVDIDRSDGIVAAEATKRISELFHKDNQWNDLSNTERKRNRQEFLKPLVDDFFSWAKEVNSMLPQEGATSKGLRYCINQEEFLRRFLSDSRIPMDNNPAEQAIRPFTVGRKNWVNIYSPNGAQASAILYSLVETAKANDLKVYEYFEYLLQELPQHQEDTDLDFLKDLMPWSKKIQKEFRKTQKT